MSCKRILSLVSPVFAALASTAAVSAPLPTLRDSFPSGDWISVNAALLSEQDSTLRNHWLSIRGNQIFVIPNGQRRGENPEKQFTKCTWKNIDGEWRFEIPSDLRSTNLFPPIRCYQIVLPDPSATAPGYEYGDVIHISSPEGKYFVFWRPNYDRTKALETWTSLDPNSVKDLSPWVGTYLENPQQTGLSPQSLNSYLDVYPTGIVYRKEPGSFHGYIRKTPSGQTAVRIIDYNEGVFKDFPLTKTATGNCAVQTDSGVMVCPLTAEGRNATYRVPIYEMSALRKTAARGYYHADAEELDGEKRPAGMPSRESSSTSFLVVVGIVLLFILIVAAASSSSTGASSSSYQRSTDYSPTYSTWPVERNDYRVPESSRYGG